MTRAQTSLHRFLALLFCAFLAHAAWAQVEEPPEAPESPPRREEADERRERHEHAREVVAVGNDVSIKAGEVVKSIVVVGGSLRMDGEVLRDVVVVAGEVVVNGPIEGDLVVVAGPVTAGPKTEVDGDAVFVGSAANLNDEAQFHRGYKRVPAPDLSPVFRGMQAFVTEGVMKARPLPPGVRWVWFVHLAFFLAILGIALLFPGAVAAGTVAIEQRPIVSLLTGVLTAILFLPVFVLLAATVIGIPVMIIGLVGALMFGKASVMQFIGQGMGRSLRLSALESSVLAVFVGALILTLLYITPVLGFVAWALATTLGLGAAMVAIANALSNRPTEPTPTAATPGYVAPVAGAAPVAEQTTPLVTVAAAYRRVGFWKRFLAALLDWLLLIIPLTLTNVFFPLVLLVYFVGMWTWKGTTIGKIVLGLKIVRIDGGDINFAVALVRSLSSFFSAAVVFLGFFWAGWDREKQSWHDKIAGTVVVQVPRGVSLL